MHSIYDRPRMWLLGSFCIAAAGKIPHGVAWANNVLGLWRPPQNFAELEAALQHIKRPLYARMLQEKVRVDPDSKVNAIMTGVKLLVSPAPGRLTLSEEICIDDAVAFLAPTLLSAPQECRDSILTLTRGILKQEDYELAS